MSDDPGAIADELYGLDPADFTTARDADAKRLRAAGQRDLAKEVAGFRKPSASAWALNQLARAHPDELAQLAELGSRLAAAQAGLEADALRQLSSQRRQLVTGVARQTRALAHERGHPLSEAVAREVEATLEAVLADPDAAAAVRAGRLVRSLEHTGFGVDLEGAVAAPKTAEEGGGSAADAAAAFAEARQRASEAAATAERAEHEAADAAERARAAAHRVAAAAEEVEQLEARLVVARDRHSAAAAAAAHAHAQAEATAATATSSPAAAEEAARDAERPAG